MDKKYRFEFVSGHNEHPNLVTVDFISDIAFEERVEITKRLPFVPGRSIERISEKFERLQEKGTIKDLKVSTVNDFKDDGICVGIMGVDEASTDAYIGDIDYFYRLNMTSGPSRISSTVETRRLLLKRARRQDGSYVYNSIYFVLNESMNNYIGEYPEMYGSVAVYQNDTTPMTTHEDIPVSEDNTYLLMKIHDQPWSNLFNRLSVTPDVDTFLRCLY